ncbi:hypothetical protein ACA910_009936 [Epithemia clementina (nom. ined.)]
MSSNKVRRRDKKAQHELVWNMEQTTSNMAPSNASKELSRDNPISNLNGLEAHTMIDQTQERDALYFVSNLFLICL